MRSRRRWPSSCFRSGLVLAIGTVDAVGLVGGVVAGVGGS